MQKYILTIKESNKRNPHTREIEFSCRYDNLSLDNAEMGKYLNQMSPKGYFVTGIKKVKEKKAD